MNVLELIGNVDVTITHEGDNEIDKNELVFKYTGADDSKTTEINTLTRQQLHLLRAGLRELASQLESYLMR